jgi:hypothetical protein
MNDRLTPPTRRALPSDVRDRIRAKVSAGLAPASTTRTNRLRAPLAAAASVAVLAAGAMIVVQSVSGVPGGVGTSTTSPSTTSGASLNRQEANAELDRCWAAVQHEGKAEQFPDRAQWRPVFNYSSGAVHVTAARAAGKPLFCETTYTRVTVSDPNATPTYAPGTKAGAVLTSRLGTTAGVVDPSWPRMWWTGPRDAAAPATVKDGLFLVFQSHEKTGAVDPISVTGNDPARTSADPAPLPAAPTSAVSIVDRPTVPAPDRSSPRGRLLDECLKAADENLGVVDIESWAPGAVAQQGDDYVIMARNAYGFTQCARIGGSVAFASYIRGADAIDQRMPVSTDGIWDLADGFVVSGTVPVRAGRLQVELARGPVVADVANSTFALFIPPSAIGPTNPKSLTVRLYDASNNLIYDGPLN